MSNWIQTQYGLGTRLTLPHPATGRLFTAVGYEAVFEQYRSGRERVTVLLSLLGQAARPVTIAAGNVRG